MVVMLGLVAITNQGKSQSPPQIAITEAYANAGTQSNGVSHPWTKIVDGDTLCNLGKIFRRHQ